MKKYFGGVLLGLALLMFVPRAEAHCDSVGGPVVADARLALKSGDVTPALKWIRKEDEGELRKVFARVVALNGKDAEARGIGEQFFFETLVRLHRASEGAPYTGLKPEAVAHDPVIQGVDTALESGSGQALVDSTLKHIRQELSEKFERAELAKKKSGESVEAGRAYVHAYVELVHYVEALHGGHAEQAEAKASAHLHE